MKNLFVCNNDWTGLVLRITIAGVLFPHGSQKLLGMFGGKGFKQTMHYFVNVVHLPAFVGLCVVLIEFLCPLLILLGALSRLWAAVVMIVMMGVIFTVQHRYFFMNWFNDQAGEGMEFFLLMIGLCVALILNGSGRYAIDHFINSKLYNRVES